MQNNSTDYNEALELKSQKGIDALNDSSANEDGSEEHDPLAIKVEQKTVFSSLVDEMRKTLRYYMKTSNQAFFNKFYLTGGSAEMLGLKEYVGENLNVDVEVLDPFHSCPEFDVRFDEKGQCVYHNLVDAAEETKEAE